MTQGIGTKLACPHCGAKYQSRDWLEAQYALEAHVISRVCGLLAKYGA